MKSIWVLSLLLGIAGSGSMGMAQSPGTFSPTGNLTTARQFHTATLLHNGKVLVTGGYSVPAPFSAWASAELYDPSTGTFTAAGSMTAARFSHTATLLPTGKVLIAGGDSNVNSYGSSALASAELFDPATGTFTATGKMTMPRSWHSATLLNNGKVLIASGSRNRPLGTAELYDPLTGTFTATGDMTTLGSPRATLLANGKVLFEGSYGPRGDDLPDGNELYDPDTGTFRATGAKARPDLFPVTASLLNNGKVLVTSQYSCDASEFAEVYDPSAETSTATGKMSNPRGYSTATLLPDGKVLVAGREWVNWGGGSADLYDPVTGIFSSTGGGTLMQREEGHTATLLPNGTVLLSGGWLCCGYSIATAAIYHPALLAPSPMLFSVAGGKQGAILHAETHQVVSPDNPAVAGEALEIYFTGLTDGGAIPPQVAIGGRMAQVLFHGNAPGFQGLNQVNVRMPGGIESGPAVPVRLTYLSRPSNEVTIGVQ